MDGDGSVRLHRVVELVVASAAKAAPHIVEMLKPTATRRVQVPTCISGDLLRAYVEALKEHGVDVSRVDFVG